jgi:hypothetical protein
VNGSLRTVWTGASALLIAAAGACRIEPVAPTPLAGPMPTALVIAPPRDDTGIVGLGDAIMSGCEIAMRARGYRVLPLGVGYDLFRTAPLPPVPGPAELQRVRAAMDVDAVLLVEVLAFDADASPFDAAKWDLQWRLLSTRTGEQIWQHRETGSWHRDRGGPVDPTQAPDAPPRVQPFGQPPPQNFQSVRDLAAALHRAAASRLPRRNS